MIDMERLKPCPFCGCNDRREQVRRQGNKGYRVICSRCGAAGPYIKILDQNEKHLAQEQAKRVWNNRLA